MNSIHAMQALCSPVARVPRSICFQSIKAVSPTCRRHARRSFKRNTRFQASAPSAVSVSVQSYEQLKSWLASKAGNAAAVEKLGVTSRLEDGTPILVAAKDISAGDAVLTVPDSLWITAETVKRSAIGNQVLGLEPWIQLALFLIVERFQSSQFSVYLNSFPEKPPVPVLWTDEQLAMLQGSQLLESLQGYRAFFAAKFQELQQQVFSLNPSVFKPDVFTYENFLWAVATVRSRIHAPLDGDQIALVPVADLVSHRRAGNVSWKTRSAGLFGRGQVLVLEANRAIRKGEELSMDFNPEKVDNAVLLDYGVLDSRDPRPGYSLSVAIADEDRYIDDKLDILETNSMQQAMEFTLTPTSEPSEEMLGFLRLRQLSGADAFLLEALFRNDVWGHLVLPVSRDNEQAVCQSMAEGASEALQGYQTTIDEDLALLRSSAVAKDSIEEAAIQVRLGEKEALEAALRFFEQRQLTADQLEYYQERRLRRLGLIDDEGRTTFDSFFKDSIA